MRRALSAAGVFVLGLFAGAVAYDRWLVFAIIRGWR